MDQGSVYIPIDRRHALYRNMELPVRTEGAALFADISGFTPLTEALAKEFGPQRGAEELTRHLNTVYDALIFELHRYGGSVLGFSGDAITCWLDGDDGLRAIACALSMQQVMEQFAEVKTAPGKTVTLAIKVAIAAGRVRRFLVGDPRVRTIDVMSGATLDDLAEAEHKAGKGEVVVDPATLAFIGDQLEISEWRADEESGVRYGVVTGLKVVVDDLPWPELPEDALSEAQVRPWLLPAVYERLRAGQGGFLAELRPAVALFLRFAGIDYEWDIDAADQLDAFVRLVQGILTRYEGTLIQLTIGDKGSYMYAAFGAPQAHEDDVVRALSAALDLRRETATLDFIEPVEIGITRGRMRTGAYGSETRRTYGVLGDAVNLSARLMQAAQPGEILVSEPVFQVAADEFAWESKEAIRVKGKSEPITLYSLLEEKERDTVHLHEPQYALPMVGRQKELNLIEEKLALVKQGKGQVIGITSEAGLGKTRLVAEAIRLGRESNVLGYGGECQSYAMNTSYYVWQTVWQSFFAVLPSWSLPEQVQALDIQLKLIDPKLAARLPLLSAVLNIKIPDNEMTESFDAKLRKVSLEGLLVDCLRARALEEPLFIILEDTHWLDEVSHDLLEAIARAIVDLPVLLLVTYRPTEIKRLQEPRVALLPHFSEIPLTEFSQEEAQELIRIKIAQIVGAELDLPADLVRNITRRAEGNPFYIEELLNYLSDRGIDPHDEVALKSLQLPASLHSLILSRIDQLTESQRLTLKVASVIGRLFSAVILAGVYPQPEASGRITADLERLRQLELTMLERPEPELAYLFKNAVTQEVTYETLPFATRSTLHEQVGQFIEITYPDRLDQFVDLLAFHYSNSENLPKRKEYLEKAGRAAQADYASEAAIDYYERLLVLLDEEEKVEIILRLVEVLQVVGRWQEAGNLLEEALAIAERLGDRPNVGWSQTAKGDLLRKQGAYDDAAEWLDKARQTFEELNEQAGLGQVLHNAGTLEAMRGNYETAQALYNQSLVARRQLDDRRNIASLLSNLGIVDRFQGNNEGARALYEESLAIREDLNDKWAIAVSLNNLGLLAVYQGNYEEARPRLEQAVALTREIGDRWYLANSLHSLGNAVRAQEDYETALSLYEESLTINEQLGDQVAIAYLLEDLGCLAAAESRPKRALRLAGAAESLRKTIGAPLPPADAAKLEKTLASARESLTEMEQEEAWSTGRAFTLEQAIDYAVNGKGA